MDSENNILKYSILEVEQPIGTFYLAAIPANVLFRTVKSARRSLEEGVQRDPSKLLSSAQIKMQFSQLQSLLVWKRIRLGWKVRKFALKIIVAWVTSLMDNIAC